MDVIYGHEMDKGTIEQLLLLDARVYPSEQQGDFQSLWNRFMQNKDSYTIAQLNGKPIGYVCAFPITDELYDMIKARKMLVDTEILPEQIKSFKRDHTYNLYIISFVIKPEYQGSEALKYILHGFANQIERLQGQGIRFNQILGHAISDQGYKLLQSLGFHTVGEIEVDSVIMETKVATVIETIRYRLQDWRPQLT